MNKLFHVGLQTWQAQNLWPLGNTDKILTLFPDHSDKQNYQSDDSSITWIFHDERHQGATPDDLSLPSSEKLTFFPPPPCVLAGTVCVGDCGRGGGPPLSSEYWAPGCVQPPLSPADSSPSQPCSLFQDHRLAQIPSWKAPRTPARPPGCPGPGALLLPMQRRNREANTVEVLLLGFESDLVYNKNNQMWHTVHRRQ